MKKHKQTIGLAGEYSVASELCRRGIYAQLTLGQRDRTDLLIETEHSMLRVQVKAKQGKQWPNIKGIFGEDIMMVMVDYEGKSDNERPDFYIMTARDWLDYLDVRKKELKKRGRSFEIDDWNCPIWVDQINSAEKPYKGCGIEPRYIRQHKEKWEKILNRIRNEK